MRDAYLFSIVINIIKFQIRLIKMKKRFALAAAFAFSMIPFTSSAGHLQMEADHPEFELLLMTGELSHRDLEGKALDTLYRLGLFTPLEADLSYANLKDADLEGLSLVNADFTGAILVGTNLSNANLARATLNTVISSLTDLKNVNLTGADLSAALLGDDLDCRFRGKLGNVGIVVDEDNEEVTYTYKKGSYLAEAVITTFTTRASITSDLIKWGNNKTWIIDRRTGRITQDSFQGKCKKTKTMF